MTTILIGGFKNRRSVVEAFRLERYDNFNLHELLLPGLVVEAFRLERYDNICLHLKEAIEEL